LKTSFVNNPIGIAKNQTVIYQQKSGFSIHIHRKYNLTSKVSFRNNPSPQKDEKGFHQTSYENTLELSKKIPTIIKTDSNQLHLKNQTFAAQLLKLVIVIIVHI
jgi:hypothetical protein